MFFISELKVPPMYRHVCKIISSDASMMFSCLHNQFFCRINSSQVPLGPVFVNIFTAILKALSSSAR